jgi:hypothetical protein
MAEPAEAVTFEEAAEAAWDEVHDQLEGVEDQPEVEQKAEQTAEPEQESEQPEAAQEPADVTDPVDDTPEDLLEPQQHWPDNIKEVFTTFNRSQQEAWMERERLVQSGFEQRRAELENVKGAMTGFQELIAPLVPEWDRQALSPSAGVRRLVALEKDLRENPSQALTRLAQEYGVNLEQTIQDQPYVDPQTRALQTELQELKGWREEQERQRQQSAQQQQQAVQQQAVQQIQQYASLQDDSGNLKYPYITDDTVLIHMTNAVQSGQAVDVLSAYEVAMEKMKGHPFFKAQVQQQSKQAQATVQKAKNASKTVTGDAPTGSPTTNQDAETLRMLEEAGYD